MINCDNYIRTHNNFTKERKLISSSPEVRSPSNLKTREDMMSGVVWLNMWNGDVQLTVGSHDAAAPSSGGGPSVRGRLCLRLTYDACGRTLAVCVVAAGDVSTLQQMTTNDDARHELQHSKPTDIRRPSVYVKITVLPRRLWVSMLPSAEYSSLIDNVKLFWCAWQISC